MVETSGRGLSRRAVARGVGGGAAALAAVGLRVAERPVAVAAQARTEAVLDAWAATPGGAAVEWVVEATNAETGNAVSVRGASFLEVAGDKIAWETAYYDNTAFGGQADGYDPGATPEK